MIITDDVIRKTIEEGNYIPDNAKKYMTSEEFREKYGPEALKKLSKQELLYRMFGLKGHDEESMTFVLENDDRIKGFYTLADPGNASNKILNYSLENSTWRTMRTSINQPDAEKKADEIRDCLKKIVAAIDENANLNAENIRELCRENGKIHNQPWLKKYLFVMYPDKFMPMHNDMWISKIFAPVGLTPKKDWYTNAKMFSDMANGFGIDGARFYHVITKCVDDYEKMNAKETAYVQKYSKKLLASKNIILRGAPGTGKTFLAREIAADIVSGGQNIVYDSLTNEEKSRVGFVQFHPSYDYSDFVEGLRPVKKSDDFNGIGFECRDGIFKEFADRARGDSTKNYVFIIDEINRGEISKILGELFFAIDPGYRGKKGEVTTQYANMHEEPDEKFYIPENVYIIGTMNDIDRSVDTFDFAMRRRFRFIEIQADNRVCMLDDLDVDLKKEAVKRMERLNRQIEETEGLNSNYHVGPAYFRKLDEVGFDDLWSDYLEPLLHEYVSGMPEETEYMNAFKDAYDSADKNNDAALEN